MKRVTYNNVYDATQHEAESPNNGRQQEAARHSDSETFVRLLIPGSLTSAQSIIQVQTMGTSAVK